jgi:hypothetical protein
MVPPNNLLILGLGLGSQRFDCSASFLKKQTDVQENSNANTPKPETFVTTRVNSSVQENSDCSFVENS